MTQNPLRDFKGIWIPKEIWLHPRLSYLEKILWAEIDSLDHPETGCVASNEYFCEFFGEKERVLQRALANLKKLGLIKYGQYDGRHRILHAQNPKSCTSEVSNLTPLTCQNLHLSIPGHIERDNIDYNLPPLVPQKGEVPPSGRLKEFFFSEILKVKPDFSQKPSERWGHDFEKLLKLRSEEEIKKIIAWALEDPYWRPIVLSPTALITHLDQLELRMKTPASKGAQQAANKKLAELCVEQFEALGVMSVSTSERSIVIPSDGQGEPWVLSYTEGGFSQQLASKLRKMGYTSIAKKVEGTS